MMTEHEMRKLMQEPLEVFSHYYLRLRDKLMANPIYSNRMTELVASIASVESVTSPLQDKDWGLWRLGKAREESEWRKPGKR